MASRLASPSEWRTSAQDNLQLKFGEMHFAFLKSVSEVMIYMIIQADIDSLK